MKTSLSTWSVCWGDGGLAQVQIDCHGVTWPISEWLSRQVYWSMCLCTEPQQQQQGHQLYWDGYRPMKPNWVYFPSQSNERFGKAFRWWLGVLDPTIRVQAHMLQCISGAASALKHDATLVKAIAQGSRCNLHHPSSGVVDGLLNSNTVSHEWLTAIMRTCLSHDRHFLSVLRGL